MYGKPFNHKKPFGTIYGTSVAAFEQDGQRYNGQKQPIDNDGNIMPFAPSNKNAIDELEDVPTTVAAENPEDDIPEDEKPFNILAWAQGDEKLVKTTPWNKVKAEAAILLGDHSVGGKEATRKAILAHYGIE